MEHAFAFFLPCQPLRRSPPQHSASVRKSELGNKGHKIETRAERDKYGFAYRRLASVVGKFIQNSLLDISQQITCKHNKLGGSHLV
jgi:hypothetical protein